MQLFTRVQIFRISEHEAAFYLLYCPISKYRSQDLVEFWVNFIEMVCVCFREEGLVTDESSIINTQRGSGFSTAEDSRRGISFAACTVIGAHSALNGLIFLSCSFAA